MTRRQRIFANEPCQPWMIVPRPIVVEPRAIIFPPGVLERVAIVAGLRRGPERLVSVLALHGARGLQRVEGGRALNVECGRVGELGDVEGPAGLGRPGLSGARPERRSLSASNVGMGIP